MQFFELLFWGITLLFFIKLLVGTSLRLPKSSHFILVGCLLLIFGAVLEGLRWQMILAYAAFAILTLASFKKSKAQRLIKIFSTMVLASCLILSLFLSSQLPVIDLPAPNGSHAVGTFSYSVIDESRIERYAPDQKRALYVQVWYPTDQISAKDLPVRTLWQEMYSGSFDLFSFFSSHLKHIDTHAHINSPIITDKKLPVLLFSHGLFLVAEQNTVLMEHLASHGYVIFSIARPYQSAKVNLNNTGSITATSQFPSDAGITKDIESNGEQVFYDLWEKDYTNNFKTINALVTGFAYATNESNKRIVVKHALASEAVKRLEPTLTVDSLYNLLAYLTYNNRSIDSWVKDIQFVANHMTDIEAPIDNFLTSINVDGFGVFGMSRGGAASAEFCKIDNRCRAGINMDGFQYGEHWDTAVPVPFLMMYSTENSGMNDFAYLPAKENFTNITIEKSMHADFTDLVLIMPLIHRLELGEKVDAKRINTVINSVQLKFFDRHLK